MKTTSLSFGCYARVISTGRVGRIGAVYREDLKTTYGLDWGNEYNPSALERITPAEYHASADNLKMSKENPGY